MITFSDSQFAELQKYLDAIQSIFRSAVVSDDTAQVSHPALPVVARPKRKPVAPSLTTATFTYRWLPTDSHRITTLYQHLLRARWIAADTTPDDFLALFSGNKSICRIRWTGKKTCLAYLFRLLTDRQYITSPKSAGRWVVVGSRFADAHNRMFTRLHSQRIPLREKNAIDQLAEVLNAACR